MARNNKLGGKTEWAERRRPTTRRAGYQARAKVRLERQSLDGMLLTSGDEMILSFEVPGADSRQFLGFGGWFRSDDGIEVSLEYEGRHVLTTYPGPDWNKVGAQFKGPSEGVVAILRFVAKREGIVSIYNMLAGGVSHNYIDQTLEVKPHILDNQWFIAPEGNFFDPGRPGSVRIDSGRASRVPGHEIILKSCNRCGRFLPVNTGNERNTLSFSNHHSTPTCTHPSFGRIAVNGSDEIYESSYGFQLECRFCKKFEVNLALNPQRTVGQMKEDGQRRRHFQLLLEHLYRGSDLLRYRNRTGRELSEDIFKKFDGRCFKCGTAFAGENEMHLDHTRPLAMLWPLDETATALCATHNSEKRDRAPSEFYSDEELARLANITGIPLAELRDPSPNLEAVELLGADISWLHDEFLELPALQRVHDGKRVADLVAKALQRVLDRYPGGAPFNVL